MTDAVFQPPRQERSVATLDRFVRVAEELLAEGAFESATVDDIVARAKSSKGSFYARFGGREAFTRFLQERCLDESRVVWDERLSLERWKGAGLREVIDAFVRHGSGLRNAPAAVRAMHLAGSRRSDGFLTVTTARLNEHVVGLLTRLLKERRTEHGHSSPSSAARFVFLLVDSSVRDALFTDLPDFDPRLIPHARLRRDLVRAVTAYLG